MTLDCRIYKRTLEAGKELLSEDGVPNAGRIGITALSTGVPIIAVAYFYGDNYGYDDALCGHIERLCKFYDVDEVIT